MKNSRCYKKTSTISIKGIIWHSTGANNPTIKRYVQPDMNDPNYKKIIKIIGKNEYGTDWNTSQSSEATHAVIGKLANGTIGTVQCLPWNFRCWGCGSGKKGSGNDYFIQFEICEDNLQDKQYFNKVYQEAVELTAFLCQRFNINPKDYVKINNVNVPTILCHAEANKLGFASNHADVLHWFKIHGKTMQNVRDDVEKLLREEDDDMTQEQFNKMMDAYIAEQAKKPTSDWAKNVMNWAIGEGIIVGDVNGNVQAQKFITRQECLTLIQRLFNKLS